MHRDVGSSCRYVTSSQPARAAFGEVRSGRALIRSVGLVRRFARQPSTCRGGRCAHPPIRFESASCKSDTRASAPACPVQPRNRAGRCVSCWRSIKRGATCEGAVPDGAACWSPCAEQSPSGCAEFPAVCADGLFASSRAGCGAASTIWVCRTSVCEPLDAPILKREVRRTTATSPWLFAGSGRACEPCGVKRRFLRHARAPQRGAVLHHVEFICALRR